MQGNIDLKQRARYESSEPPWQTPHSAAFRNPLMQADHHLADQLAQVVADILQTEAFPRGQIICLKCREQVGLLSDRRRVIEALHECNRFQ